MNTLPVFLRVMADLPLLFILQPFENRTYVMMGADFTGHISFLTIAKSTSMKVGPLYCRAEMYAGRVACPW